ncbi:urease accessory protein UreF [Bacillus sp. ISL-4]|uniref:urease accessory protein UreF n=1 Tax=Bacillus sp. ISL-4 TaxID=2819125 RepID=UPI001BE5B873|nr:urease accessory protein UreF [Bacillus sp. ISL-4]MBT2667945.1 urease accessory protein UreF [Bacillus sp. ISL-4]MBT2672708.1 urease accessory protein UreF [Streptomyces sp. ISL-14]
MNPNILSLFQLCDSNFPTGAFSHSYGLETYIQEDQVYDQASFSQWLHVYLNEQLVYSDGLATRLVYEALENEDVQTVWKVDRMLTVQNLPRETREGTKRMGERMVNLVGTLYEFPVLSQYQKRIKEKHSFGHPAIAFTMIGHHLGVPKSTTTLYYLYSTVSSLVQNAVRAIPLGQTAGQKTIHEFQSALIEATEKIQNSDEEDFGIISPGLELSQMKHERVNIRIFMS